MSLVIFVGLILAASHDEWLVSFLVMAIRRKWFLLRLNQSRFYHRGRLFPYLTIDSLSQGPKPPSALTPHFGNIGTDSRFFVPQSQMSWWEYGTMIFFPNWRVAPQRLQTFYSSGVKTISYRGQWTMVQCLLKIIKAPQALSLRLSLFIWGLKWSTWASVCHYLNDTFIQSRCGPAKFPLWHNGS